MLKKRFIILIGCFFILLAGCSNNQADKNDLRQIANKTDFKSEVNEHTNNNSENAAKPMVNEELSAVKALKNFYGITDKTIVIYEQVPFENDCVLILADRFRDGEHYPDLYLVSPDEKVLALTRHSYCWSMNYTQHMGYKIFYGLAASEIRQLNNTPLPIKKLEAVFNDKTYEVKTRENIIAQINNGEHTPCTINNPHAYILPVKDENMPDDVLCIFSDDRKISLSQLSIDRNYDNMPEYLKSKKKNIFNSYAFTYSPMMSPEDWERVDSDGETGLKGKTDENGNLNALFLRPSAAVFKTVHSFGLPYDIRSFYLSYNYPIACFSAGERVEVVYSKDYKLYDCRVLKLNKETVDKDLNVKNFHNLSSNTKSEIILPKEPGHYLFILRTEKHSELHSYMGVVKIIN